MDVKSTLSSILGTLFLVFCVFSFALAYPQDQQTGQARTSRGSIQLQNSKLSTARGFGKRDHGQFLPGLGTFYEDSVRNLGIKSGNYPNSGLTEEIQNNPEMLRSIVEKLVDLNRDGEMTAEETERRNIF